MSEPTFKSIFGENWKNLPPVMVKHYANRPYSNDTHKVTGVLDVSCKAPLQWIAPLMKLLGQIPAQNEKDVPVEVLFQSEETSAAFHFVRTFNFKKDAPYIFHSRMLQTQGNEVIEIMRFHLCWRLTYHWENDRVILKHKGYGLYLWDKVIPLPLTMILGKGYAEEVAVNDTTFDMFTHITHPLWGKIYEYRGRFEVVE
ncbi:DUF4166 domain-containing protein [Sneathiella sp. P13V-1]|uniref:DUF4166 domain-containing protein n=1 Tax=Sneathiella sp. P13V-1 TaxID=2697366 RepID=UPI00187B1618|nr:DUF4166 domain-containing protein [Sneathiella sp. P13V-1]MBE7636595.1 DUF4166 domain-containing protein [Sneathiella sp. P13V-1]